MNHPLTYLQGLGNHFESEALPDTLLRGRNSPQQVPYHLYAEQLNGSAFTAPRHQNLSTWMYRIRPSVLHGEFLPCSQPAFSGPPCDASFTPPTQMRWNPRPYTKVAHDFISGLMTFAGNGSIETQTGAAIHLYEVTKSMENRFFYNADGEFLIVAQEGLLQFDTELGCLSLSPGEILVIPRGIKYRVILQSDKARGYICENFGAPFRLPELGVLGAHGLANRRDFQIPTAYFDQHEYACQLLVKFQGHLWQTELNHSPLDVVAWHGNYVPYKYALALFNTINTVSFDHPDPSIFTVLTSPTAVQGVANMDFVIFPPRWMVAEATFRPPYYHRNVMSEYMGLINGSYDAKGRGFIPGGASLHNCMSAHGPDAAAYAAAIQKSLKPEYFDGGLAFMFESQQVWRLTEAAYTADFRQKDYLGCWQTLQAPATSRILSFR